MANGNGKGHPEPDIPSFDAIREILHDTVMLTRRQSDLLRQHSKAIVEHDQAMARHDQAIERIDERLDRVGRHLEVLAGLYEESVRASSRKRKRSS